jgi:hypothetical protein
MFSRNYRAYAIDAFAIAVSLAIAAPVLALLTAPAVMGM